MLFVGLSLLGLVAWQRLPMELMPALQGDTLFVQFFRRGAEPEVVEREMRPVVDRVGTLSDDAARLSTLAVTRIERVDEAFERITSRLEEMLKTARGAVAEPARQGMVLAHVLRAGLVAMRSLNERSPRPDEAQPRDGGRARSVG